jgi:hypothetical protein
MPSKKNTSGRSKKARKAANMVEEQQETPDAQMERLKIDDDTDDEDALLKEAIKLSLLLKKRHWTLKSLKKRRRENNVW